jgi:ubiquinone/menaquinone biosynthesis C-methylase UbiE
MNSLSQHSLNTPKQLLTAFELTAFCKATAEGLRLNVLRALKNESFGVTELCEIFKITQPGMSHHLKALLAVNLVATRREGNSIFYRRAMIDSTHPLADLTSTLFATVDNLILSAEVDQSLREVYAERAQRSREFFDKTADKFSENQDLITDFNQYADPVLELISNEHLPFEISVLEVGPGNSELLKELAARFEHVTAMDNSAPMLERARNQLGADKPKNIEFRHSDLADCLAPKPQFHLVVLNMVTHHLASPTLAFKSAMCMLHPGGCLLIVDLCPHNQDWTRDACGDLWLGFEPEDLNKWALENDLTPGQSLYLGLKNGFQIQARLYHKPSLT